MGVLCMTTVIPAKAGIQRGWATGGAHDLTVNPSYVRCAPPSLCEGGVSKRSDASGGCSGWCGV